MEKPPGDGSIWGLQSTFVGSITDRILELIAGLISFQLNNSRKYSQLALKAQKLRANYVQATYAKLYTGYVQAMYKVYENYLTVIN